MCVFAGKWERKGQKGEKELPLIREVSGKRKAIDKMCFMLLLSVMLISGILICLLV